jgi:hypothetical protein
VAEEKIGDVTSFIPKPMVAMIKLQATLSVGDSIHLKGATTDLIVPVRTMQVERQNVDSAEAGAEAGIPLPKPAQVGDEVFIVIDD